jgi:predicted unusual protein kinase regulating ubiquinone biosynthesis (AarF/ABC1/UbiB family)
MMLEAEKKGFTKVIWIDSGCYALNNPEPLFTAFYELPDLEHHRLIQLTERFLHTLYKKEVRPKLEKILSNNIKGKNLLLPLIDGAIEHLPPDKCMTAIISILCTPKEELTQGRIISIVLQELGGIYVKLAQVLSELAPPVLSKELKHQQDKLGLPLVHKTIDREKPVECLQKTL